MTEMQQHLCHLLQQDQHMFAEFTAQLPLIYSSSSRLKAKGGASVMVLVIVFYKPKPCIICRQDSSNKQVCVL